MKKCESCVNKSGPASEVPCLRCRVQFPGNVLLDSAYTEQSELINTIRELYENELVTE